jgi:ribosome-associated toxin RatA of RatAB toxin-antitoxin module
MARVEKKLLLEHSVQQMFELVEKVEDYPKFLPWCGGVEVHNRTADSLEATIRVAFKGINPHFTTRNQQVKNQSMTMTLVDGPFKKFEGAWHFTPLSEQACKIEFSLNYEFSNPLFAMVIGPVFNLIASTFVDSFVKRADELYVKP